ncbi:MAG: pyridoxine 5'-phosphate synthase [Bacteroidia bacterium]
MTRLSVNINKIALIRNSRGHNNPNLLKVASDCEAFGADGITIHPRPDERHIKYLDAYDLKQIVTTELNIEGNPQEEKFVKLVLDVKPAQVTLVPDAANQLTSNHGWDTIKYAEYLKNIIQIFKQAGIRTSIFVDPIIEMVEAAKETGTDCIELYTESYAKNYFIDKYEAVKHYVEAANKASQLDLILNAGHDLDLNNLRFLKQQIPFLAEVSIGHALVCDALYYGLENIIQMYKRQLE